MKKLILLSIILIVGCEEYAPTDHTHDGHYSCIHNYIYHWVGNDAPDDSTYVIDTLNVLHQPNINEAISECNTHYYGYMGQWIRVIDSTWCECEAGILY